VRLAFCAQRQRSKQSAWEFVLGSPGLSRLWIGMAWGIAVFVYLTLAARQMLALGASGTG